MKIKELTIDEMLKLKAVVLYVINKCDEIDYFHLFKILYLRTELIMLNMAEESFKILSVHYLKDLSPLFYLMR